MGCGRRIVVGSSLHRRCIVVGSLPIVVGSLPIVDCRSLIVDRRSIVRDTTLA